MMKRSSDRKRSFALPILLACLLVAAPAFAGEVVKGKVTVILDKLPDEYRARMEDFHIKLTNYINERNWIEEDFVAPFVVGFQFFLEYSPSSVEDRYTCSLIASGPDIQYFDKRAIFPFQENETIQEGGGYVPINGLVDYYVYLIIANELDKYGALEGTKYIEIAHSILREAKFSKYVRGWDVREDNFMFILSEEYKKFREMKDFYFYGLWATDKLAEKRDYVAKAVHQIDELLKERKDFLAVTQFIDAHHLEIVDLFRGTGNTKPIETLLRLDPDRKKIYEESLGTN